GTCGWCFIWCSCCGSSRSEYRWRCSVGCGDWSSKLSRRYCSGDAVASYGDLKAEKFLLWTIVCCCGARVCCIRSSGSGIIYTLVALCVGICCGGYDVCRCGGGDS